MTQDDPGAHFHARRQESAQKGEEMGVCQNVREATFNSSQWLKLE